MNTDTATDSDSAGRSQEERASIEGPDADPVLGVLFVHGFGGQKRGDTLVRYGEPIASWLNRWIDDGDAHDRVKRAVPVDGTLLTRAQQLFGLEVPAHGWISASRGVGGRPRPTGRWLLAESWWAGNFSPASFSEVAAWGVGIGPWVFARYLQTRWRDWRLWVNLQNVIAIVLGPLLQLLILVLLLLAIVPFMRRFVGSVMLTLADTVGDSFVLVSSPMRFDAMVNQVRSDLRWLGNSGCRTIAVVAHSQGTVVAQHALWTLSERAKEVPGERENPIGKIKLFVTFGTAIDKLHRLQQVVPTGRRVVRGGLLSTAGVVIAFAGPAVVAWQGWTNGLLWGSLSVVVGVVVFYLGVFYPISDGGVTDLTPDRLWPDPFQEGSTLRWHDYVALADPVPDGRLPFPPPHDDPVLCDDASARVRTCPVRNRDSVIRDHSIYAQNAEQFVAPVVRALTEDAGWQLGLCEAWPRVEAAMRHRTTRVWGLTVAYVTAVLTTAIVIAVLSFTDKLSAAGRPLAAAFNATAERLTIPLEAALTGGAESPFVVRALGVALVLIVAIAWHRFAVLLAWRNWDRAMIDLLFAIPATSARSRSGSVPDGQAVGGWGSGAYVGATPFLLATAATVFVIPGLAALWFRYVV